MIKKIALSCILALASNAAFAADDIVETAKGAGIFKTLVAALDAGGKTQMLKEDGPFTVFAPNDDAFAKLPEGTVEDLLKPENKAKLANLLAYHVLKGKVMAADVKTMMAETANGAKLDIKVKDGVVTVNDATVVTADVDASNGVIHVIDTVLMPPSDKEVEDES
ncbi:MAG: fasciclin domain-containing protein [Verrucomicrobiales bacterium]|nr:fasciclin domain-containing protein [Verrucomicrobiales bacterium]